MQHKGLVASTSKQRVCCQYEQAKGLLPVRASKGFVASTSKQRVSCQYEQAKGFLPVRASKGFLASTSLATQKLFHIWRIHGPRQSRGNMMCHCQPTAGRRPPQAGTIYFCPVLSSSTSGQQTFQFHLSI